MTDPISFPALSPRFAMPLLFAGQSQKEVTVNEALLLSDLLLHPVVEGIVTSPPASPTAGSCWIVGPGAVGAFAAKDASIAAWTDGGWRFITPRDGLRVFDRGRGAERLFLAGWRIATAPAAASGGTVIDVQARSAIASLITLLKDTGIFSAT